MAFPAPLNLKQDFQSIFCQFSSSFSLEASLLLRKDLFQILLLSIHFLYRSQDPLLILFPNRDYLFAMYWFGQIFSLWTLFWCKTKGIICEIMSFLYILQNISFSHSSFICIFNFLSRYFTNFHDSICCDFESGFTSSSFFAIHKQTKNGIHNFACTSKQIIIINALYCI